MPSTASPRADRLPVDLVTGFLGSGKTTLINAVLRDPGFAGSMVIVNEFGEVGLDHLLVAGGDDQVVLLDSGCLCCAASGSLRDTLIDLFARRGGGKLPAFDRIIVETSGLANPSPLVATLIGDSALTSRCRLAQVLTLVDPLHAEATLARFVEARHQVAVADRLVIGKTDSVPPDRVEEVRTLLAARNPAAVLTTWRRDAPAAPLFTPLPRPPIGGGPIGGGPIGGGPIAGEPTAMRWGPIRRQYADEDGDPEAAHGPAFGQTRAHVFAVPGPVDWARYAQVTGDLSRHLGRRLLRCKGLLALDGADAPSVIQGVQGFFAPPERLPAWPAGVASGFLVLIGEGFGRRELESLLAPILTNEGGTVS